MPPGGNRDVLALAADLGVELDPELDRRQLYTLRQKWFVQNTHTNTSCISYSYTTPH